MTPAHIFITGAWAGIGRALAEHYAARLGGQARLGLVARRADRLAELAEALRARGTAVETYPADVTDQRAMVEACRAFEGGGGAGVVIANAGISRGERVGSGDPAPSTGMVATNVQGVLNTLVPFIPPMMERRAGALVAMGSVAGFRGIPGKGVYCASKAALKTLMDGYRPLLRPYGIRVTTICPGWVESEMTADNPYDMPFLVESRRAARLIAAAIARGRRTYVFPWQLRLAVPVLRLLPERMLPTLGARP